MVGKIRIGRCYYKNNTMSHPKYPGFSNIFVLTKSSAFGELGPYVLTNKDGHIMENIWQFSKIYKSVPRSIQRQSQYNTTIVWDYPEEIHINENNKITPKYWEWRNKGMNCKFPIRYPVGKQNMKTCVGCLIGDNNSYEIVDYIEARKRVYFLVYTELVMQHQTFKNLKYRLSKGENLLIEEVDGPHQESLLYYKNKYNVDDKFIENETIECKPEYMKIMLNDDDRYPFGHGYCLAMALSDMTLNDLDIIE